MWTVVEDGAMDEKSLCGGKEVKDEERRGEVAMREGRRRRMRRGQKRVEERRSYNAGGRR